MVARPASVTTRQCGQQKDCNGHEKDEKRSHLHFVRFDLVSEIFGRAPDQKSGDKDGNDHEYQHPVEP